MARIVLGLATSHGPMLSVPWQAWTERVPADRANPRHFYQGKVYTFDQMVELHRPRGLAAQLTPEVFHRVPCPLPAGHSEVGRYLRGVEIRRRDRDRERPMEIFTSDRVPAFAIFRGDYVEGIPHIPEFLAKSSIGRFWRRWNGATRSPLRVCRKRCFNRDFGNQELDSAGGHDGSRRVHNEGDRLRAVLPVGGGDRQCDGFHPVGAVLSQGA